MNIKKVCVLLVMLGAILNAVPGSACSVGRIAPPEELVHNADLIVLATALDYAGDQPGNMRTTGVAPTRVRFRIESVLKGDHKETTVRTQNAKTFSVIFRSGAQEFTVTDPARLAEIEKKMDEIDFWNSTKFPLIVGGPFDETCDSRREQLDLTAVRETVKTVTFIEAKCANTANNRPVQEFRSLIELIQKAAPKKP